MHTMYFLCFLLRFSSIAMETFAARIEGGENLGQPLFLAAAEISPPALRSVIQLHVGSVVDLFIPVAVSR